LVLANDCLGPAELGADDAAAVPIPNGATTDAADSVEEGAEDVGDKVEEATE